MARTIYSYRGRPTKIRIGDRVNTREGVMTITGFGVRDCGPDDGRTGMPLVEGHIDGETYGPREFSWAYLEEITLAR
jgi:acyl-[acyl carrier protein]--UDP-N-acetylglucosamine O-acyltransferase